MLTKSFSEALGIFDKQEQSFEPHIFCFGGGGGGGGDTGGSTHPGRPGGESGERGNRSDRGDGNDRDDRGGGGDDDRDDRGGSDRNFNVSPVGAPSYPQAPDYSARQAPSGDDDRDEMDRQMDAIDAQFDAMDRAYDRGDTFATSGDTDYVSVDSGGNVTDSSFDRGADIEVTYEQPAVASVPPAQVTPSPEEQPADDSFLSDLTDAQLDDAIAAYDDASTAVGQDVKQQLEAEKDRRSGTETTAEADIEVEVPEPDNLFTYSEAVDYALSQGLDPIDAEQRAQEMIGTTPYSFDRDVEVTLLPGDYEPTGFEETFVPQDRVDVGVPVSTLPEGSYQIDPETNTVSLNEEGRSYMDALAKGYRNEENEFGIDRQEIESLMQEGAVVGAPMVQVPTSIAGQDGSIEGSQARAGEGEDESGLAGGMAGKGRLGDSAQQATVEETPGVINIELFDSKILDDGTVVLSGGMIQEDEEAQPGILAPAEGEEVARADADAEGLGLLPDEGGIGILPGEGGLIGTDSGIIGQSGSQGINPFTEGGDDGEGDETVRVSGPGESEEGEGPGTGDGVGTGTPPPVDLTDDGGDDGFEVAEPAPVDPYDFGDSTYDPLLDFEYRQPQITSPFDFARDFGSYTLSPEIEQAFQDLTERRMDAGFEPAALYEPEFLEQIGIMTPERQAEPGIASLIGSRFPQITPVEDRYPFASTPEDYAQSLVDAMRDSS